MALTKDPSALLQMRSIKQEIDKICSEEVEKKIRFMRQRYYEAGPKEAKLVAWRLHKQQAEKSIYKLRDPITNKLSTKLEEIQKLFETYYKLLYTQPEKASEQKTDQFLNSLDLPSLGKEHDKLTSEISSEEIDKAISALKAGKSPGTDGYPPEWYKLMRESLLPLLKTCFNHIMSKGTLPPSWREAYISVIQRRAKTSWTETHIGRLMF